MEYRVTGHGNSDIGAEFPLSPSGSDVRDGEVVANGGWRTAALSSGDLPSLTGTGDGEF